MLPPYAEKIGAEVYKGLPGFKAGAGMEAEALAHNMAFIKAKMAEGYKIIDAGPDFARRAATGIASKFYEAERQLLKNYSNYEKAFTRP